MADVAGILARRKYVCAVVFDNTQPSKAERQSKGYVQPNERIVVWELCFADMHDKPVHLQFHVRQETGISGSAFPPKPGASLKWKGVRIRGVNWNLRHDNMLNGQPLAPVRGWHEKQWTDADQDKHIVDVNEEIGNTDFRSLTKFCCKRWNIELPEEMQYRMGDL